ncbi:haspin protein kinase protein [Stemphylium lycopersici]|uniref:non-specific serine/threonine protein kinase n=1 Tax=Stemphylium lycopersici TaxID=183478 RepID=A0A364N9B3_STELY|nr:haspin protein kinase protein [Stemphylium lycopersici]RAR03968.1 haspin protein kinase protein [Stemphylium lycopersici]RAR13899.1 haspin protein kinase protein [Stemphylium lycopersici]
MPPKVVYGKRRNGERTAFTKFLSPEKDVAHRELECQNAASITTDDWREQLLEAAEPEKSRVQKDDDVSLLERGLDNLQIKQTRIVKEEGTAKKKEKPRKAKSGRDADVTKENIIPFEDALEQSMQSLAITAVEDEDPKLLQKPRKPRKVLSDRNINASNQKDRPASPAPKQKKEKKRAVTTLVTQDLEIHSSKSRSTAVAGSKPRSPQRRPQSPAPEPTPDPDDLYSVYASPLLALSDRKKIISFQDWSDELEPHFEVSKIAEASFSEVYRLSSTSSTNGVKEESVLKMVALKTPPKVPLPCQVHGRAVRDLEGQIEKETAQREEEDQFKSQVDDVLSEVKLLQNLTHIPGFTVFRDLTLVQGRPSTSFNDAWKEWNKARPRGKKSEFPDPSKKTSYDENQLWAVVEMQDAGTDCEKMMEAGGMASIWEVWDVFWGVAISVGKAEEACRFEHRDLHLGNICVRSSRTGGDVFKPSVKDPLRRKMRFTGLDTTVIDYTLSRADIKAEPPSRRMSNISHISSSTAESNDGADEDVDVAYLDLDKDPAIFEGDASEEYQYEIYRYMRGVALFNNPLQFQPPQMTEAEEDVEEEEEEEEEEKEEEKEGAQIPATPRRSPRKNTHIRFDAEDEEQKSPTKPTPEVPQEQQKQDMSLWSSFHPKTNLVWLHFLLHKLLNHLSSLSAAPHNTLPPSLFLLKKGEEHDAATSRAIQKKAVRLYKVLQRVSELLCPVALGREGESLESVKELVVLALEERWVRVGDVAG